MYKSIYVFNILILKFLLKYFLLQKATILGLIFKSVLGSQAYEPYKRVS
jgi:hypothetical protein